MGTREWGDKFIAWSDFCFDASTDAERLVRAVATGADYPLAVHGMVGREAGSALKPGSWVLSLDAGRSSVPVRLRARERAYIDYPRGSRILAYGLWGGWPTSEPYGEVRVWCDSAGSVDTVGFTRTAPGRGGR
jgi:hypothetical protein